MLGRHAAESAPARKPHTAAVSTAIHGQRPAEFSRGPSTPDALARNLDGDDAKGPAEPAERVGAALESIFHDARHAEYRNLRRSTGANHGEVSPRLQGQVRSPFRPFHVTPEGGGAVRPGPRLAVTDPSDSFVDLYIRWCASIEELRELEEEVRGGSGGS